ncbi:UNVERIFIED_CONTAM: hypothetical protein FKN15_023269 [Acipenser sinensis]
MQFYFFDLRNPSEVLLGETPFVEEKGPYTYREFRPKENVRFSDNDTKVSATMPKTYVFVPEMSVGRREDDPIRTVNVPAVTMIEKFKTHPVISNLISSYMKSQNIGLFVTRTVHELLWGYKDPLLAVVHKVRPDIDEYFGLFYKMNTTDDGEYVVLTGEQDYKDFARIVEWRGERKCFLKGFNVFSTRGMCMFYQSLVKLAKLTGILVRGAKRVQVNAFLEKIEAFRLKLINPNMGFPYTGSNQTKGREVDVADSKSVEIDAESADKVKSVVYQANVVINIPFIIMAFGILLGVIFIVFLCKNREPESHNLACGDTNKGKTWI